MFYVFKNILRSAVFPVQLLSHRRNIAKLSLIYSYLYAKYSNHRFSSVQILQSFTSTTCPAASTNLNCTHCLYLRLVMMTHRQIDFFSILLLFGTFTRVYPFRKTTVLISSSERPVVSNPHSIIFLQLPHTTISRT